MAERADALVVGGGPAGLATAIALRTAGLGRVRVLERFRPPIDKACGEGLMPDGAEALRQLGVAIDRLRAFPFRGIRYVDGPLAVEGTFPRGVGLGIRRLALHQALIDRALEAGVELLWHTRVEALNGDRLETSAGPMAASWIVAADGLGSRLRAWAGLAGPAQPAAERRFGVRRHFRIEPWAELVEVHWHDTGEAYVTPVAADEVGVAMLWRGGPARFDQMLPRFPALAARLACTEVVSKDRGAGPLLQKVKRVTRGRLALVGDASGYVDAITGEGLSLAFHQARALADAIACGDLRRYERAHRRIGRGPDTLTRLVLALERRPRLRRRAIAALAAEPEVFCRLLGVHSRSLPLSRVGLPGAVRLAWRLATG